MKTKAFISLAAATIMASCTDSGEATADNDQLTTDSVKFEQKDKASEVSLKADFPTAGNKTLTNILAEYISEQMGGTYTGALTNGDSIINYYGQAQKDSLTAQRKELGDDNNTPVPYFYSCEVKKAAETGRYVTYTTHTEIFLGGAHGDHSFSGATFRKSDGRHFGYDMLRNTDSDAFRKLIKEGLIKYFNTETTEPVKTDEQLKNCLLVEDDVNYLPLPRTAPYLTQEGMVFTYQTYEIAPYAAGMPSFTVPLSKIRPFLTATALQLTGGADNK